MAPTHSKTSSDATAAPAYPFNLKALFKVKPEELAQNIHDAKIVPIVALISAFIKANSSTARAGYIYSLASLFTEAPPITSIMKYANRFSDMEALFTFAQKPEMSVLYSSQDDQVMFQAIEQNINEPVTIDLTKEHPISIGTQLIENVGMVRMFVALIALLCSFFGISQVLKSSDGKTFLETIKSMSMFGTSTKNVLSCLSEFVDTVLPSIYSFFGVEYHTSAYQAVSALSDKIEVLYKDCLDFNRKIKVDFFGVQKDTVDDLQKRYDDLAKEHHNVITQTKSTYNFSSRLNAIDTTIRELFDIITEVYKCKGGKQRPVVIWICGRSGIGKSYIGTKFAQDFAAKLKTTVYSRTWADEYWTSYRFQGVVYYDDMRQVTNQQKDVDEFMRYTGDDAKSVICADIPNKGNPFLSTLMVCTSNHTWLAPPLPMSDFEAVNRRRDAVVYVHFPEISEYKSKNNGSEPPTSWFETHSPRFFLVNPTWGATLENSNLQDNLKFSIDEDWVIGEISYQELIERTWNLHQQRAEVFRQNLIKVTAEKDVFTIPQTPFTFDPTKLFIFPKRKGSSDKYNPKYKVAVIDASEEFHFQDDEQYSAIQKKYKLPTTNWEDALSQQLDMPLLVFPYGKDAELFGATGAVEGYIALRKWRRKQTAALHFINPKGTVCKLGFSIKDDTEHQGSPLYTVKEYNNTPAIIIQGPPGTGKTFLVEHALPTAYKVKYCHDEVFPENVPLFFDDITINKHRLKIAMNVVQKHHEAPTNRVVVLTLNKETDAWKNFPSDQQNLILRRSHVISVDYSKYTYLRSSVARVHPSEYLKQLEERDKYLTWHFSLFPRRGKEIESLDPSACAVESLIREEMRNGVLPSEMMTFNKIEMPHHPCPDLKIFLPHESKITADKVKLFVRRNGEYCIPTILESADIVRFAYLFQQYLEGKICDREDIPLAINTAQIKNTTSYKTCQLAIGHFTMTVETINGVLLAYQTIDDFTDYSFEGTNLIYKGQLYTTENDIDCAIVDALLLAQTTPKTTAQQERWNAAKMPDMETYWTQQTTTEVIGSIIGICEVACQFGLSFSMIRDAFSKPEQIAVEEEQQFESAKGKRHYREKNFDDSAQTAQDITYDNDRKIEERNNKKFERGGKFFPQLSQKETDQVNTMIASRIASGTKIIYVPNAHFSRPGYETRYDDNAHSFALVKIDGFKHESAFINLDSYPAKAILPKYGKIYAAIEGGKCYFASSVGGGRFTIFSTLIDDLEDIESIVVPDCPHKCKEHDLRGRQLQQLVGRHFQGHQDSAEEFVAHCYGHANIEALTVKFKNQGNEPNAVRQQGAYDQDAFTVLQSVDQTHRVHIFTEGNFFCSGMMLKDNLGITVAHAPSTFQVKFVHTGDENIYDAAVLRRAKANDVMSFKITTKEFARVRDITKRFITDDKLAEHLQLVNRKPALAVMLSRDNKTRDARPVQLLQIADAHTYTTVGADINSKGEITYQTRIGMFGSTGLTEFGDCGSPAIIMSPTLDRKMCGIHSRGNNEKSILAPVTYDYLDWILSEEQTKPQAREEEQHIPSKYLEYGVDYQDAHGFQVIAHTPTPVFIPTTTTEYLSGINWDELHEPTIKSKRDFRNITKKDYFEEAVARYNVKVPKEEGLQDRWNLAAKAIGEYLSTLFIKDKISTRMLTITEGLNGVNKQQQPFSKPLERHGAVGWPYSMLYPNKPTKIDYLKQNQKNLLHYFTDEPHSQKVLADTARQFDDAKHGISHEHLWTAFLKDEVVKLSKIYDINKSKTRIFFSGSMSYLIAYRRAFASALWGITQLHLHQPIRVGIRARSLEWQIMAMNHAEVSTLGFDSDMQNWDGTVPIEALRAVPIIFNTIYKHTDPEWKPEHDTCRSTLHRAVEGAKVIVKQRVIQLTQAMASGFPGTAIENSLINWMLYFLCWQNVAPPAFNTFAHFMSKTCLSVYGDDNLCTVAPEVAPFFNFNVFKHEAGKFGFIVTDAAKSGGCVPDLQPITSLQFLKRGFKKDGWKYIPAIEEESISKMVQWIRNPQGYEFKGSWRRNNDTAVFEASFLATLEEVALHGREFYNKFVEKLLPQTREQGYAIIFPEFEELERRSDWC